MQLGYQIDKSFFLGKAQIDSLKNMRVYMVYNV